MVVDLPAPLPPDKVVTNSSKSKVRAKNPFQLINVNERNFPRSIIYFLPLHHHLHWTLIAHLPVHRHHLARYLALVA